ncbi:MAG: hypothetical protein Q4P84_01095 [Elusimicrobiales bacterium]|nr:hypothetical protein [Elusimicrobiales bacterium]
MRYIGIDIGDGESAAALVEGTGAALPRIVDLGAERSMLSVVGEADGIVLVGAQVLLEQRARNIEARFKSRFLTNPEASVTIGRFARGLRDKLAPTLESGDCSIALGCPAGWTRADRERYVGIVRAAGFTNLHPVAESRAAFLYARYDSEIGLSPGETAQPTLVIDIGSSTTDFAYIVEGKESDVGVFGANRLGGGQLDRLILEDALNCSGQRDEIVRIFQTFPTWRSKCELEARKLKETYFQDEALWQEQPCKTTAPIVADVHAPKLLNLSLDGEKMNQLLDTPLEGKGSQSFRQRLEEYLQAAVEKTAAHPPQQVILTGGASRMAFFQTACREAFPEARILLCRDPEFSIARGLSIAARIDDRLELFRKEIEGLFREGVLQNEINRNLPLLLNELVPILEERIMNRCIAKIDWTMYSQKEQCLVVLRDKIRQEFEARPSTPETDQILTRWIGEKLTGVQARLDDLCKSSGVERADMSLAKIGLRVSLNELKTSRRLNMKLSSKGLLALPGLILALLERVNLVASQEKLIREELRKELSKPGGEFARSLAGDLEAELRAQIQENVDRVEVHIS